MIPDNTINPVNYEIYRPLTPFERACSLPLPTIPNDDEDTVVITYHNGTQSREPDKEDEVVLLEAVNKSYEHDQERQYAEMQDRWIREYRAKMFRNVLNPTRKPKK